MALPKLNTRMEVKMAESKKKFVMFLVWHNCKTHPPSENYNSSLVVTNGKEIFEMCWDKDEGYYTNHNYLKPDAYERWWWADLEQTVRCCSDFM